MLCRNRMARREISPPPAPDPNRCLAAGKRDGARLPPLPVLACGRCRSRTPPHAETPSPPVSKKHAFAQRTALGTTDPGRIGRIDHGH